MNEITILYIAIAYLLGMIMGILIIKRKLKVQELKKAVKNLEFPEKENY